MTDEEPRSPGAEGAQEGTEETGGTGNEEQPELALEKRLDRLDEIARQLEKGEVGLEDALSLFEEGVRHVRRAQELLSRAELRVQELVGEGDEAESRPLEEPGSGTRGSEPDDT